MMLGHTYLTNTIILSLSLCHSLFPSLPPSLHPYFPLSFTHLSFPHFFWERNTFICFFFLRVSDLILLYHTILLLKGIYTLSPTPGPLWLLESERSIAKIMTNTYIYCFKLVLPLYNFASGIYSILWAKDGETIMHTTPGLCHLYWSYLDENCQGGTAPFLNIKQEKMAVHPEVNMIADTLVSNFYYCSLENLVRAEWSGSKGLLFPGNMHGHI